MRSLRYWAVVVRRQSKSTVGACGCGAPDPTLCSLLGQERINVAEELISRDHNRIAP